MDLHRAVPDRDTLVVTLKIRDSGTTYHLLVKASEVKSACRYHRGIGCKVVVSRTSR